MSPLCPGISESPPMCVAIDMDPTMRKSSLPAVHTAKSLSSLPVSLFLAPVLLGWFQPVTAILSRSRTGRTSCQEWENGKRKWQSGCNQVVYRRTKGCIRLMVCWETEGDGELPYVSHSFSWGDGGSVKEGQESSWSRNGTYGAPCWAHRRCGPSMWMYELMDGLING